jgi:hypothetical protein
MQAELMRSGFSSIEEEAVFWHSRDFFDITGPNLAS